MNERVFYKKQQEELEKILKIKDIVEFTSKCYPVPNPICGGMMKSTPVIMFGTGIVKEISDRRIVVFIQSHYHSDAKDYDYAIEAYPIGACIGIPRFFVMDGEFYCGPDRHIERIIKDD